MSYGTTLLKLIATQHLVLLEGPNGYKPTVTPGMELLIVQTNPHHGDWASCYEVYLPAGDNGRAERIPLHNLLPFNFDDDMKAAGEYVKGLLAGKYRTQPQIDKELVKKLSAYIPAKSFNYDTPRHSGSGFNPNKVIYQGDGMYLLGYGGVVDAEGVAWAMYHNAANLLPGMKKVGDLFAEKERMMWEAV